MGGSEGRWVSKKVGWCGPEGRWVAKTGRKVEWISEIDSQQSLCLRKPVGF
jgi:hypothetical protein